tara:strand:- start:14851 stop:15840 length:990 start_codon:yes stop_codon:yes gene_type:complete
MTIFPVTTSTLSAKELGEFIMDRYQLPKGFGCELFRTGINHTYFLSDKGTKYVIRVYSHQWRSRSEIIAELHLLRLLKANDIRVSFPIEDKNGEFIQELNAPEGIRYVVLFSFAVGGKVRVMTERTCFAIGSLMARMHELTENNTIERTTYNKRTLMETPYDLLKRFFPAELPEMEYIKSLGTSFKEVDFKDVPSGVVHMDIWYDNMAVHDEKEITLFDFDFCGNGWQILDVAYFCKQLFFLETDKNVYKSKVRSFLDGYRKVRNLSDKEMALIPQAGAAVFVFYLGVQARRFDWSNIFLTENYLKMFVGRIRSWLEYHRTNGVNMGDR